MTIPGFVWSAAYWMVRHGDDAVPVAESLPVTATYRSIDPAGGHGPLSGADVSRIALSAPPSWPASVASVASRSLNPTSERIAPSFASGLGVSAVDGSPHPARAITQNETAILEL